MVGGGCALLRTYRILYEFLVVGRSGPMFISRDTGASGCALLQFIALRIERNTINLKGVRVIDDIITFNQRYILLDLNYHPHTRGNHHY